MGRPSFRAWDKDRGEMCGVRALFFDDDKIEVNVGMDDTPDWRGELFIMQSTGLKDKNGKEIFEGDILSFELKITNPSYRGSAKDGQLETGQVIYYGGSAGFGINEQSEFSFMQFNGMNEFEVIGNIYENLELLSETTDI